MIDEYVEKYIEEMAVKGSQSDIEICDETRRHYILVKWEDGYFEVLWEDTGEKENMDTDEMEDFLRKLENEDTVWVDADSV